jgi:hypothetical protein
MPAGSLAPTSAIPLPAAVNSVDMVSSLPAVAVPAVTQLDCIPSSIAPATSPAIAATEGRRETSLARRAVVEPLAPELYKIQFTATAETHAKLRRAQELMRHQIRSGDLAAIIDRGLTLLVAQLEKAKLSATSRPRAARPTRRGSRHIPAGVRREVWRRDGGRCAFMTPEGKRCTERGFLEFHHVRPHGDGGEARPENIELRCRAHNSYEADVYFGPGNEAVRNAAMQKRYRSKLDRQGPPGIVRESPACYGRSRASGSCENSVRTEFASSARLPARWPDV